MTITTIYCDACSELVRDEPVELLVERGRLGEGRENIQLCSGCASALEAWLVAPSAAFAQMPVTAPSAD